MKFTISHSHCPCGADLKDAGESAGFCVACANATCSSACHEKYLERNNLCNFHQNFTRKLSSINMRSIVFNTSKKFHDKKLSVGTSLCKTSRAFLFGTLGEAEDQIY